MWSAILLLVPLVASKAIHTNVQSKSQSEDCSFSSDDVTLSWTFDELSSDVVFKLRTRTELQDFWTGFYMGEEKPKDALGVLVRAGQIGVVDGKITHDTVMPDPLTNVQSLSFDLKDGELVAEFARPLIAKDENDTDLSSCTTFFFKSSASSLTAGGDAPAPRTKDLMARRVCNLPSTCNNKAQHSEPVKRQTVCSHSVGDAHISWKKEKKHLVFNVDVPFQHGPYYTAAGLGHSMQDMKVAITFVNEGEVESTGTYKGQGYGLPEEDKKAIPGFKGGENGRNEDGRVSYSFTVGKKFISSFTENGCLPGVFAPNAGLYQKNGKNFQVHKHDNTPSTFEICGFEQCSGNTEPRAVKDSGDVEEEPAKLEEVKEQETETIAEQAQRPEIEGEGEVEELETGQEEPESETEEEPEQDTEPEQENESEVEGGVKEGEGSELENEEVEDKAEEADQVPVDEDSERNNETTSSSDDLSEQASEMQEEGSVDEKINKDDESSGGASISETEDSSSDISSPNTEGTDMEESSGSDPNEDKETHASEGLLSSGAPALESDGCPATPDLKICEVYFADYLIKVGQWADRHNQTHEEQRPKACKLLGAVNHVPEFCCHMFHTTCGSVIDFSAETNA